MPANSVIRLYSFQTSHVVDALATQNIYYADWKNMGWPGQRANFEWMAEQMAFRGIHCGTHPPVWAWHSCGGWKKPPRQDDVDGLLGLGWDALDHWYWLALDVPTDQVLLSSYRWWNALFYDDDPSFTGLTREQLEERIFRVKPGNYKYDSIQAALACLQREWLVEGRPLKEVYPTLRA